MMAESEPRLSRRDRRRLDTRREILAAARELMLEVGPEALSLRQVARRADFSPAALYTYFASRDELIGALFAESFARLDAYLGRVSTDLPVAERVVELGMAYMEFGRDNPMDLRCILSATSLEAPQSAQIQEMGLGMVRMVNETFQEGMEKGLFDAGLMLSAPELAYAIWALVHGMVSVSGIDLTQVADVFSADPRRVLEAFVSLVISSRAEQ
jgi:AcrR family transcriptional regulator